MGTGYKLDAIASAVIGGVMTSRFTFVGVDAYLQDIVKGIIIVAAVVADRYRQRRRKKA